MEKKQKFSRKRQAIWEMLQNTKEHPSAETIYNTLKPNIPDLSLATVYRNLAAFQKEGLIISVGNVHGQERYDGTIYPHPHFICRECGRVSDLPVENALQDTVTRLTGDSACVVENYALSIYGKCGDCNKKVFHRDNG